MTISILGCDNINERWTKKRLTAYTHIARLPFDNPARVALYGQTRKEENVEERRFFTVKSTMMRDIKKILKVENYCELCNKKIRNEAAA